jgi:hypothetical protein
MNYTWQVNGVPDDRGRLMFKFYLGAIVIDFDAKEKTL